MLGELGITTSFRPANILRQRLVHPKDKLPKEKRCDVVYGIKCQQQDCNQIYIRETSQPLAKRMYQHRRPSSGDNDSVVFLHLQESGHSFNNRDVNLLDWEPGWYEGGVKEAIYERSERPSLNRRINSLIMLLLRTVKD